MTKSVRNYAVVVGVVLVCIAGIMAARLVPAVNRWRRSGILGGGPAVIRRAHLTAVPGSGVADRHGLTNLAPLATVTVSSHEDSGGETDAGVADGAVDIREWVATTAQGAWIKLTWDHPVSVAAVELYDRRSLFENVLRGALIFEDGLTIPVPALPADGSAWSVRFAPRTVQSVLFRIDSSQGTNAGLAEIMVYGTLSPP